MYYNKELSVSDLAVRYRKSERTIYRWLQQANQIKGKSNKTPRKKHIRRRKYPPKIFARIVELKEEIPQRSAPMIRRNLEQELLRAQNQIESYQAQVFERIKNEVEQNLGSLRQLAQALASLDSLLGFAKIAYQNNYVAPSFNQNRDIEIKGGRHPVIEQKLDGNFQPNDIFLSDAESLWIITGPNMGGKSTFLRQVALICLMGQCSQ